MDIPPISKEQVVGVEEATMVCLWVGYVSVCIEKNSKVYTYIPTNLLELPRIEVILLAQDRLQ